MSRRTAESIQTAVELLWAAGHEAEALELMDTVVSEGDVDYEYFQEFVKETVLEEEHNFHDELIELMERFGDEIPGQVKDTVFLKQIQERVRQYQVMLERTGMETPSIVATNLGSIVYDVCEYISEMREEMDR